MHKQGLTPDEAPVLPGMRHFHFEFSGYGVLYLEYLVRVRSSMVWGRLATCTAVGYRRCPRQSGQLAD